MTQEAAMQRPRIWVVRGEGVTWKSGRDPLGLGQVNGSLLARTPSNHCLASGAFQSFRSLLSAAGRFSFANTPSALNATVAPAISASLIQLLLSAEDLVYSFPVAVERLLHAHLWHSPCW